MKELIIIQNKLKSPKDKDGYNKKYKHRSVDAIIEAVKPDLSELECLLTLSDEIVMFGERFYIKATAKISKGDVSEQAYGYAREALSHSLMSEPQLTGSSSTYARKTALCGLLLIDDSSSNDPDNADYPRNEEQPTNQSSNNGNDAFDKAKKEIEEQRKILMDEIKGIRLQMEDSGYQFDKDEITFFDKLDTVKYAVPELKNKVIPKLKEKQKLWEEGQFPDDKDK